MTSHRKFREGGAAGREASWQVVVSFEKTSSSSWLLTPSFPFLRPILNMLDFLWTKGSLLPFVPVWIKAVVLFVFVLNWR